MNIEIMDNILLVSLFVLSQSVFIAGLYTSRKNGSIIQPEDDEERISQWDVMFTPSEIIKFSFFKDSYKSNPDKWDLQCADDNIFLYKDDNNIPHRARFTLPDLQRYKFYAGVKED